MFTVRTCAIMRVGVAIMFSNTMSDRRHGNIRTTRFVKLCIKMHATARSPKDIRHEWRVMSRLLRKLATALRESLFMSHVVIREIGKCLRDSIVVGHEPPFLFQVEFGALLNEMKINCRTGNVDASPTLLRRQSNYAWVAPQIATRWPFPYCLTMTFSNNPRQSIAACNQSIRKSYVTRRATKSSIDVPPRTTGGARYSNP